MTLKKDMLYPPTFRDEPNKKEPVNMQRALQTFLSVCFLCTVFSFSVFAFKTAPFIVCYVDIEKSPAESRYLEMLVQKKDIPSKWYTKQPIHLEMYGLTQDAPIAVYDENGFVSYMLHCTQSAWSGKLLERIEGEPIQICFGEDESGKIDENVLSVIKRLKQVRFAYLDEDGNILSLTEPVRPNTKIPFRFREAIQIQGEDVQVEFVSGPPYWLILLSILGALGYVTYLTISAILKKKKQI